MKYCNMRIPDPIPFGLTFLLARLRAIDSAFFVNSPSGGNVETVLTPCTHFFCFAINITPSPDFFPGQLISRPAHMPPQPAPEVPPFGPAPPDPGPKTPPPPAPRPGAP